MLTICIQSNWKCAKVDVEAAFLLGKLDEEIYIELPDGIDKKVGQIGRLNSALYGLVQAARVFYKTIKNYLINELRFVVCISDSCIFVKRNIILGLYVDDILIVGSDQAVRDFTGEFVKKFKNSESPKLEFPVIVGEQAKRGSPRFPISIFREIHGFLPDPSRISW